MLNPQARIEITGFAFILGDYISASKYGLAYSVSRNRHVPVLILMD
jgi:hypothetical protein